MTWEVGETWDMPFWLGRPQVPGKRQMQADVAWVVRKCASPGHGSAAQRAPWQGRSQAGRELPAGCAAAGGCLLLGDRHLICCHIMAERHRQEIGKAPVRLMC